MKNKEIEHGADSTELENVEGYNESRVYELGFHIDPELPQEEVKKVYQGIHELIASKGAIVAEGEPVKIPLAYTISRSEQSGRRDFTSAFFSWIAYETEGPGHDAIMDMMKSEARIVRYIDLRTTKEAAHHSAEMAEIYAKMPEEVGAQEEDLSDTELDAALKEVGAA